MYTGKRGNNHVLHITGTTNWFLLLIGNSLAKV